MEQTVYKHFIRNFIVSAAALLIGAALAVVLTDPFFHYHKPWFGLKAVQTQKEYQLPGAIRHLDYDSVLLGSSVVMGMNTTSLDERCGGRTIKIVGDSASAEYLCWHLRQAYESRDIRTAFWGFDIFSLYFGISGEPMGAKGLDFMWNKDPFDDAEYFWNIELLCDEVPYMIYSSYVGDYDEGTAYSFVQDMECGKMLLLSNYPREETPEPVKQQPKDWYIDNVRANLDMIESVIEEHPETDFVFFIPAYSILWWDNCYRQGRLDAYIHVLGETIGELLEYDNVSFYGTAFNDECVIMDLDEYADYIHGSLKVCGYMTDALGNEEQRVTNASYKEEVDKLREVILTFEQNVSEKGWQEVWQIGSVSLHAGGGEACTLSASADGFSKCSGKNLQLFTQTQATRIHARRLLDGTPCPVIAEFEQNIKKISSAFTMAAYKPPRRPHAILSENLPTHLRANTIKKKRTWRIQI